MNYLAHAYLSPDNPEILMGNLWGDLVRPRDYPHLEPAILEGVRFHKRIDAYTDQHPSVQAIQDLLRPYQSKYTPVVVDVLMDYVLSTHWHKHKAESLEDFCARCYAVVRQLLDKIPERVHPRIERMLEHRWLESCSNRDRMQNALRMLSRRASFANQIEHALIPFEKYQTKIEYHFEKFFADIQAYLSPQSSG